MSGQQFSGWQNRAPFAPRPPFHFNVPLHDFSRPPPPLVAPRQPPPPGQFFPRPIRPPPQVPTPSIEDSTNQDQKWVDNWLETINTTPEPSKSTSTSLKLGVVKRKVEQSAFLLKELQKLKITAENSSDNRGLVLQEICRLKTEITEITEFLQTDAPEIEHLVKKRQLKRKAQKSQRGKARRLTLLLISERQAKHRQIDAWRQEQQDIVEKIKREEDTCREADAILGVVRNKQSEGKSLLQVLQSLKKLRHLRTQHAADKSVFPSLEEDERFGNMSANLEDLWQLQLEEYAKEEQTLRVMMEKEQVVRQEKQKPSDLEGNLQMWTTALFGKLDPDNYEFFLHTSAERDVNSLFNTRQCWDHFLSAKNSLSSPIPVGWVVPVKPSSQHWESLLQSNQ